MSIFLTLSCLVTVGFWYWLFINYLNYSYKDNFIKELCVLLAIISIFPIVNFMVVFFINHSIYAKEEYNQYIKEAKKSSF